MIVCKIGVFFDRNALRSFRQVSVHILIAIGLATIAHFMIGNRLGISRDNFVAIMSSIAAASGALLAVSLAFAIFMGRYIADWRERLIDRLRHDREEMRSQMRNSAKHHPEISRRLVDLYMVAAQYIPGQQIDKEKIYEADKTFSAWAVEQAKKNNKKFDFGNIDTYDSFEKHLFDASLCGTEIRQDLILLHVAEVNGRSLATYPPLITTWAVILAIALAMAVSFGNGTTETSLNPSLLIFPAYLFAWATLALLIDIRASMSTLRIQEIGYEKAMAELAERLNPVKSSTSNKM